MNLQSSLVFAVLYGLSVITALGQCNLYELPLGERVKKSELIVEGKVVGQSSFWNSSRTHIYTSSTIEIYKIFKGDLSASTMDVICIGGTVGPERETTSSLLELQPGETGVFMCIPFSELPGKYETYGSRQGFILYKPDLAIANDGFRSYPLEGDRIYNEITGLTGSAYRNIKKADIFESIDKKLSQAPLISSFYPTRISGGTKSVLTIYGNGFGILKGTVYFTDPDTTSKFTPIPPSQYILWTDDSIKVEVPSKAGTGLIRVTSKETGQSANSFSPLSVPFCQTNITGISGVPSAAYHIDQSGTGGYVWRMNSGFNLNTAAKASFIRAFNSWKCLSYINWALGPNTNENATGKDGVNVITFDETGSSLRPGVLGLCFSFYSGCAGNNWVITELDIAFAASPSSFKWQYGPSAPNTNEVDFETVALHELGHGQQLGHVTTPSDLMFYSLSKGVMKRSISADDSEGALYIMQRNNGITVCDKSAMKPLNQGNCQDSLPLYIEFKEVKIHQNPFRERTLIDYLLPGANHVLAELYDILGRRIATLRNQTEGLGIHSISIDESLNLIPGIYILHLKLGDELFKLKLYKY